MDTVADILLSVQIDPTKKMKLKNGDKLKTSVIVLFPQSTKVADEKQLRFLPVEDLDTKEEAWESKHNPRQKTKEEETKLKTTVQETPKKPFKMKLYMPFWS